MTSGELKEYVDYDELTGTFRWKRSTNKRIKVGSVCGTTCGQYLAMNINGERKYLHQLAFLYMTGEIPTEVDHIDRNGMNNKWSNLRPANRSQNLYNKRVRKSSRLRVKGVRYLYGKYVARISRDGRVYTIGKFDSLKAAADAYDRKAMELFGEFAFLNKVT